MMQYEHDVAFYEINTYLLISLILTLYLNEYSCIYVCSLILLFLGILICPNSNPKTQSLWGPFSHSEFSIRESNYFRDER